MQLVDMASIHQLELRLREVDLDPHKINRKLAFIVALCRSVVWPDGAGIGEWPLSTCSVIDFEAILIDGSVPRQRSGRSCQPRAPLCDDTRHARL
jgi:hypothetical protein